MTYYHFTHPLHLPKILTAGRLTTTESNIGSPFPVGDGPVGTRVGPDVVWLLDVDDASGPHDQYNGLYADKRKIRFEVDVRAIRWLDWAPARAMSHEWRDILLRSAGGPEVAEHWYVFPADIRRPRWVSVVNMETGEALDG